MNDVRVIRNLGQVEALQAYISKRLPVTITIQEGVKRSRAQNDGSHAWYSVIAAQLGDRTAQDVRAESKLHLGVPIRREDPEFDTYYRTVMLPLPYEAKLALMVEPFEVAITSKMTKSQMTRYLEAFFEYWSKQGVHFD
jgi:hypothetical protein